MEISAEQARDIVKNVQQAHRLCAAFYSRLFPKLNKIGVELKCTFRNWGPLGRNRPCTSSTNPELKLVWDMLPFAAARMCYVSRDSDETQPGDFILEIDVVLEEVLTREYLKTHNATQMDDPVDLPETDLYLDFCIYRAKLPMKHEIYTAWDHCDFAPIGGDTFEDVGAGLEAIGFRVSLTKFLEDQNSEDDSPIVSRLIQLVG